MKNLLLFLLAAITLVSGYAVYATATDPKPATAAVVPAPNTGNLCMCMINTWSDSKGNVETIADFAEYSGVGTTLDDHREKVMRDRLQKVFDNHLY